jgi:large subunit ribosomal protein L22
MANKYSVQGINEEHSARAKINAASVSTKHCIEICNFLRKKNLQKAKDLLRLAIEKKRAIPFKRFNGDVGHRKGDMASGRYPIKACTQVLNMLESAEANAQFKGLNTSNLIISHICANKASTPWRYGRHIRRKSKRTHIEVVVEEKAAKRRKAVEKKKEEPKKEIKPAVKKEEKPAVKKEAPKAELKKPEIKKEVPKPAVEKPKTPEVKK